MNKYRLYDHKNNHIYKYIFEILHHYQSFMKALLESKKLNKSAQFFYSWIWDKDYIDLLQIYNSIIFLHHTAHHAWIHSWSWASWFWLISYYCFGCQDKASNRSGILQG